MNSDEQRVNISIGIQTIFGVFVHFLKSIVFELKQPPRVNFAFDCTSQHVTIIKDFELKFNINKTKVDPYGFKLSRKSNNNN